MSPTTKIATGVETNVEYVEVEYRTSGVPGLVITPMSTMLGLVRGKWQVTHKASGRSFPGGPHDTIEAAKTVAGDIAAAVPSVDWRGEMGEVLSGLTTADKRRIRKAASP